MATNRSLAILAGSGRYPALLIEAVLAKGVTPFVVNLTNDRPDWLNGVRHVNIPVTRPSQIIRALREMSPAEVILAGGMYQRLNLMDFIKDWRMYGEFYRFYKAFRKGDDGLLRAVVSLFERKGFTIVGAQQVAPHLLAKEAVLSSRQPTSQEMQDINLGIIQARELGRLDLGQAVIVREGQLVAKEGRGGTAGMLKNLAPNNPSVLSGVLVKWSKPNQELRVDLPTIGPDTIVQAKAAGLAGIAIEAGRSLILDEQEVLKLANTHNMFVVGMRSLVS